MEQERGRTHLLYKAACFEGGVEKKTVFNKKQGKSSEKCNLFASPKWKKEDALYQHCWSGQPPNTRQRLAKRT